MRSLLSLLPLWIFVFFFKFAAGLHYTFLPALGERVFPTAIVGIFIASEAFIQLILDIPAGFILDRFGYRRFLGVTTAAFIVAAGVLMFGLTPWTFIITIAVSLFGWLFFEPGVNAYILAEIPHAIAGRAIALRDTLDSAGIVLSTAILTFALTLPVPTMGALLVISFLIAAIVLSFVPRDHASAHAEKKIAMHHHYIRRSYFPALFRAFRRLNPASTLLVVSGFSSSVFYGIVWFVVPILIAREAGSGIPGIGLGVFDASVLLLGFLFGRIADRASARWLVFFGLFLFALSASFLGFSAGVWFVILGFLATSGDELAHVSLWSWLHRLDDDHTGDAAIAGAIAMSHDLGWTVGPLTAGFLLDIIGAPWTISIGAGIIFIAWFVSLIMLGPRQAFTVAPAFITMHFPRRKHKR